MNFQPSTTIRLCATDLMLGNAQQIWFNNESEQSAYFMSKVKYTFNEQTYQRVQAGIMYLEVNVETLYTGVNYIMFKNENYSNKWFYANILKLSYVNPNVTRIDYALDSLQTFMFDINLDRKSYIERRHYTKNEFDKIMTLPYEDLDLGGEYVICDNNFLDIDPTTDTTITGKYNFYLLASTKPIDSYTDSGDMVVRQRFEYVTDDKVQTPYNSVESVYSGLQMYVANEEMVRFMMMNNYWQSQTMNGTLQLMLRLPFGESFINSDKLANTESNICRSITGGGSLDKNRYRLFRLSRLTQSNVFQSHNSYSLPFYHHWLERYISGSVDNTDIQSKRGYFIDEINSAIKYYLMRYPYSLIETNDFKSNIMTYKLQDFYCGKPFDMLVANSHCLTMNLWASLGTTSTLAYQFMGYKNSQAYHPYSIQATLINPLKEFLGGSLNIVNSDLSLPIISDYQNAFLQSNINQINAQRMNYASGLNVGIDNANASLNASMLGASMSYQNAQIGADTQMANAQIMGATGLTNAQLTLDNAQLGIVGNTISGISGVFANAVNGNIMGAISGGVNTTTNAMLGNAQADNNMAMSQNSINAMLGTSTNSAKSSVLQAQNSLISSQAILNTNHANTMRNNTLQYQTGIRSLNARMQDISNMPDTVQSMGSGSLFNYVMNRTGINCTTKTLPKEQLQRLSNYFAMYGFKSNDFTDVKSIMNKYTTGGFIKTVNAFITGDIPQDNLREIISLFDNGIMFWKGASNFLNWEGVKKQ